MRDIQRQIRTFKPHDYFVMLEKHGPTYELTSVVNHDRETSRRYFFSRRKALTAFDGDVALASFIIRGVTA